MICTFVEASGHSGDVKGQGKPDAANAKRSGKGQDREVGLARAIGIAADLSIHADVCIETEDLCHGTHCHHEQQVLCVECR